MVVYIPHIGLELEHLTALFMPNLSRHVTVTI